MAQEKQHLTTEELSTFLDREGQAEEQAQWEVHLSTCPQCQQALASLRQTIALLQMLPQPALPRSFLLPMEIANEAAVPNASVAPTPIRPDRRRTINPYVRATLRTISTLAAMIGVVFFFSGIGSLGFHGGGASTTASTSNSGTFSQVSPPKSVHGASSNGPAVPSAGKTLTPMPSATAIQAVLPRATTKPALRNSDDQPVAPFWPTILIFNLNTGGGRVGLGMLLVLLGVMGFVLFKRPRRMAHS